MAEKLPSGKYRTRATYTDEQGKRRSVSFTRDTAKKFFKEKAILKLLDDHRNEVCDCYKKIWTIYTFIVWYDMYF